MIGRGGQLPWHMPSDLKTFRRLTMGKPIVMGRKTFQSIGKPLDGRDNIVITRDDAFQAPAGVRVARSVDDAMRIARMCASGRGADEIMIIGGADIYRQALPLADRIYLSRVHARPDGDATFRDPSPEIWHVVERTPIARDPRDDHAATLMVYERRQG